MTIKAVIPNRSFMNFYVEACRGAIVSMFSMLHNVYAYEIELGGGSNSEIRIVSLFAGEVAKLSYPGVVACNEERPYWVAWYNGLIQVGRGSYPHNHLLEYDDAGMYPVTAVSFHSWVVQAVVPAFWRFTRNEGKNLN